MTVALLVDDDHLWSQLALEAFRCAAPHVSVHTAATVVSALDHLADECPDLVLLDLHMPGPGGLDLLRSLQEVGKPAARVVLMSSLLTDTDRAAASALGAASCLDKPASFSALVDVVAELVAGI